MIYLQLSLLEICLSKSYVPCDSFTHLRISKANIRTLKFRLKTPYLLDFTIISAFSPDERIFQCTEKIEVHVKFAN